MPIATAALHELQGLLRNTSVEVVGDLDPATLLLWLSKWAPGREPILAHILAGNRARVRLWALVEMGALSGLDLARVVRQLAANGHLISTREWVRFVDNLAAAEHKIDPRRSSAKRGRKPKDPSVGTMNDAERARRYVEARRKAGAVKKTLWLTAEAAATLDRLAEADPQQTLGEIVSAAILGVRRV